MIIGWRKAKKEGGNLNHHYNEIKKFYKNGKLDENDIEDLNKLKSDLTYTYAKGSINEQHYTNLKNEISILYEEIYKQKIESLTYKNSMGIKDIRTLLDEVTNEINDAYAKGRVNEQHYKLLIEKISDSRNKKPHQ